MEAQIHINMRRHTRTHKIHCMISLLECDLNDSDEKKGTGGEKENEKVRKSEKPISVLWEYCLYHSQKRKEM